MFCKINTYLVSQEGAIKFDRNLCILQNIFAKLNIEVFESWVLFLGKTGTLLAQ